MSHSLFRRSFLTGSLTGFAALCHRCLGSTLSIEKPRKAKRCLVLWMAGGPSQFETFDPKPGTVTGGPTRSIKTSVPGIEISEHLPRVAEQLHDLSIIRTLSSSEGEHARAAYLNHTGFPLTSAFPHPAAGSVIAYESPRGKLPGYFSLGGSGFGPAYLGHDAAPFVIENADSARRMLISLREKRGRFELLEQLSSNFNLHYRTEMTEQRTSTLQRIESLMDSNLTDILDTSRESESMRSAYGSSPFGQSILIGRRLLEADVPFVEITLDGWDTHQNNFPATKRLCETLDSPFATLIDDLKERGLWSDTLILWLGDFGRTPGINGSAGRDHFPKIGSAVIGGGPIPGGKLIGKTDASGSEIDDSPVSIADLLGTVFELMGIPHDKKYQTDFGSPTEATDKAKPIAALL